MKSLLLLILAFFASRFCYAQWTTDGNDIVNTNSGNVLIGANISANAKFRVYQQIGLGSSPQNSTLLSSVGGLAGTDNVFMHNIWLVRNVQGSNWFSTHLHDGISVDGSFLSPQIDTRVWWERDPFNNIQFWGDQNQTYMTIMQGKVGIGTVNPSFPLHIAGEAFSTGGFRVLGGLGDNTNGSPWYGLGNCNLNWTGSGGKVVQLAGYFGLNFQTAQGQMVMVNNGNVGIGTTNPDEKLTVYGTIHSSEVKVDTSIPVPDYVFQPSYKLTDLPALHDYLNKYHHLPEIPSAEQIQENGLKLGQMNMLLLKKVEELTLYLIDKDKQIQDQQSEIDQLKTQATLNRAQQEKIDKLEQKLNELLQAVNKNK